MKRTKRVTAIVVYYIVSATVLIPIDLMESSNASNDKVFFPKSGLLFISAVLIALSIGLWRMKNWARITAAVLTAIGLVAGVVSMALSGLWYYYGVSLLAEELIVLAPNLLVMTYLLSPSARRAFLSHRGQTGRFPKFDSN